MSKDGWFLPVKQSYVTGEFYIHSKSKYHMFKNDDSLCKKYWMTTDFFETNNITDEDVIKNNSIVCKQCYEKWKSNCNEDLPEISNNEKELQINYDFVRS
ncbi:hypothetical protein [Clostridium estertheticum]|uniref:hypothetical protein n=1 Tax=Clostridium estertheticum TaxID=238834 RepID=UPI001C0D2905|nr:hypothetical protein [Clostridium estertheticum]MBU3173380.1 hypothetical protein [Clostridium estertheticum]